MKARMIVDFNNETSVRYSEIAIDSFKNTDLKIERVQCVTPLTLDEQSFVLKFGKNQSNKWEGLDHDISATEQACFASHFREWRKIAREGRTIIMEHDAYLREGMEDKFNMMVEYANIPTIWNCGIAMECYTMSADFAKFLWYNFDHEQIPVALPKDFDYKANDISRTITAGPMAELLTYAKPFYIMNPRVKNDQINSASWIWPTGAYENKVATARDLVEYKNYTIQLWQGKKGLACGVQSAPVTQVFCPDIGRTIDHEDDNYGMNFDADYGNHSIKQMKVLTKEEFNAGI